MVMGSRITNQLDDSRATYRITDTFSGLSSDVNASFELPGTLQRFYMVGYRCFIRFPVSFFKRTVHSFTLRDGTQQR